MLFPTFTAPFFFQSSYSQLRNNYSLHTFLTIGLLLPIFPTAQAQATTPATQGPSVSWSKDLKVLGSLAVSEMGDVVYIGSDAKVHRLDSTGKEKWAYVLGDVGRAQPLLTPQGNTLVVAYDDYIQAIDAQGKKLWATRLDGDIFASPALRSDGSIIVASSAGTVYAVSPTGQILWQQPVGAGVFSSPVIAPDGRIYLGTQGNAFVALKPDGSGVAWRFATGSTVFSSPALDAAGNIYFGSGDKKIYSLTPTGALRWAYPTGGFVNASPIVTTSGLVIVGSYDGTLYALNQAGQKVWSYATGAPIAAATAEVVGGLLVGNMNGTLYQLDLSGKLLWSLKVGDRIDTSINVSPQGTVYFSPGSGKLSALAGQAPLADGPWSFYRNVSAGYGRNLNTSETAQWKQLKLAATQKALASLPKAPPAATASPLTPVVTAPVLAAPAGTVPPAIVDPAAQARAAATQAHLEGGTLVLPLREMLAAFGATLKVQTTNSVTFSLAGSDNSAPVQMLTYQGQRGAWVRLSDLQHLNIAGRPMTTRYIAKDKQYQWWFAGKSQPIVSLGIDLPQMLQPVSTPEYRSVISY